MCDLKCLEVSIQQLISLPWPIKQASASVSYCSTQWASQPNNTGKFLHYVFFYFVFPYISLICFISKSLFTYLHTSNSISFKTDQLQSDSFFFIFFLSFLLFSLFLSTFFFSFGIGLIVWFWFLANSYYIYIFSSFFICFVCLSNQAFYSLFMCSVSTSFSLSLLNIVSLILC